MIWSLCNGLIDCNIKMISFLLYCIVMYCILSSFSEGRLDAIEKGSLRELSEIRTQLSLSEAYLTCDPCHYRGSVF